MTVEVRGDQIYVWNARNPNTGFEVGEKYVRSVVQKKLKEHRIFGIELWNQNHPDPGTFLFDVMDPFHQFNLEDGEL